MQLTISLEHSDTILSIDFPGELSLQDLDAYLQDQLSLEDLTIIHNGSPLTGKESTLESLGIANDDLLVVRSASSSTAVAQTPHTPHTPMRLPATGSGSGSGPGPFQGPPLNPIQQSIENAIEHNPESFTQIHMLFIPIKLHPRGYSDTSSTSMAFVDTGAQTSIISPEHAEELGISDLIDRRHTGEARGVGSTPILGRIHDIEVTIGDAVVHLAFTVLQTGMDLLLGLDMMRKYGMCVDLKENCLRVDNMKVRFLDDSESPSLGESLQKRSGNGGVKLGGGNLFSPGAFDPATATSSNPNPSLTSALSAAAAAASAAQVRNNGSSSSPATGTLPATEATIPEASIQQLTSLGFSRSQAISALRQCNGNVEIAASLLFQ